MNRLLEEPENFYTYSRLYANSVAAILAWGFRAKDTESFWFKEVNAMIEQVRKRRRGAPPPNQRQTPKSDKKPPHPLSGSKPSSPARTPP